MAAKKPPQFDPVVIRELALCFARAAVDEMIEQNKRKDDRHEKSESEATPETVE
jgi:hypothetical protein